MKRRLKKWVKVLLTILIIIVSIIIYLKTPYFGKLAQSSTIYQGICIMSWIWLILGQILSILFIWED